MTPPATKSFACSVCGHEQSTMDPCEACGSVRTVLISVLVDVAGENWREAFQPMPERLKVAAAEAADRTAFIPDSRPHRRKSFEAIDVGPSADVRLVATLDRAKQRACLMCDRQAAVKEPIEVGTFSDVNKRSCEVVVTSPSGLLAISREGQERLLLSLDGARSLVELLTRGIARAESALK